MRVRCGLRVCGWMLAVGAGAVGASAQMPATSVAGVLRGMAARAGVVFVGQVQRIVPKGGVVEVTLQVQQPVLGVVGGTYVLREWAGRWTGGRQRYWVGERAMFFLHATGGSADGETGLSSPVDGMMGVVPVVPMGGNAGALLDVRWLAARVRRAVGSPMVDAATGGIALADAVKVTTNWQTASMAEPESVALPVGVRPQAAKPLQGMAGVLQPQEPSDAQR